MSKTITSESASDLLSRWMAHRRQMQSGKPPVESTAPERATTPDTAATPVEPATTPRADDTMVRTVEEFAEFAHPAAGLGGATGVWSSSPTEHAEVRPSPASSPAPVTVDAPVPHPPEPQGPATRAPAPADAQSSAAAVTAPTPIRPSATGPRPVRASTPGLVLFSPRRGARRLVTAIAAVLAVAAGAASYLAWQAPTTDAIAVAVGAAAALLLVWKIRSRTAGTEITIENGMLRIVQGSSRHLFPLAGTHPPIDILGEPGRRSWKVLIQRRGMAPFVITRRMVEPVAFSEALRKFRPDA